MINEALVLAKVIHDRLSWCVGNPFNQIECSNSYARVVINQSTFITACGFKYHDPKEYIRFASNGIDKILKRLSLRQKMGLLQKRGAFGTFLPPLGRKIPVLSLALKIL